MEKYDAIIIGGGPAGIMTAVVSAEKNKNILLIERNNSLAKKLLISGKGRCNVTNSCDSTEFLENFSSSRNFLRNSFSKFFNNELIEFFEKSNLKLKVERGGRVFPDTDKSQDVLNVFQKKLKNKNIKIIFKERVKKILISNNVVEGVFTYSDEKFFSDKVVIATGGLSYPLTGSTGDGYKMAEKAGHQIIPLKPALVPVCIKEKFIRDWKKSNLKNVGLSLWVGTKKIDYRFGEMNFTDFGISGPIVLDMSASIYDALTSEKNITVGINFKPALDYQKLDVRLLREFNTNPKKNIKNIFKNLLPQKLIDEFLQYCNIDSQKTANQITSKERKRIIQSLFDLRLTVSGVMPIKDAIVTQGGVNTKEINPKTMESKLISGMYFVGEVIDIDAKTGGYNMQAAFSTGWVCGDNLFRS